MRRPKTTSRVLALSTSAILAGALVIVSGLPLSVAAELAVAIALLVEAIIAFDEGCQDNEHCNKHMFRGGLCLFACILLTFSAVPHIWLGIAAERWHTNEA